MATHPRHGGEMPLAGAGPRPNLPYMCVNAYVRACVRACVHARVRARAHPLPFATVHARALICSRPP